MDSLGKILSNSALEQRQSTSEEKNWTKFLESLDYDEAVVELLRHYASDLVSLGVDLADPDLIDSINAQHCCLQEAVERAIASMRAKEVFHPTPYFQAILSRTFDRDDIQGSRLPVFTAQHFESEAEKSLVPPKTIGELQADLGKGRAIASLTRLMIRANPQWGLAVIEGKVVQFLSQEEGVA